MSHINRHDTPTYNRLANCALDLIPGVPGSAIVECARLIKNTYFTQRTVAGTLDEYGRAGKGEVVSGMTSITGLALDTYQCVKKAVLKQGLTGAAKKIPGLSKSTTFPYTVKSRFNESQFKVKSRFKV